MDILLASVILVIIVKTAVVTVVSKAFGYSVRTSFLVSCLAQLVELISDLCETHQLLFPYFQKYGYSIIGWSLARSNWRICFCTP